MPTARHFVLPLLCLVLGLAPAAAADKKVRLFVLSGQSNMAGLDPRVSFTPAVEKEFAGDEVIVVKFAVRAANRFAAGTRSGNYPTGATEAKSATKNGDLYEQLMQAVTKALGR